MNIGEEQAPIELPLPTVPETMPDQEPPTHPAESKPERSVPIERPEPQKVPA